MSDDASGGSPQRRDVCAPRSSPNRVWVCGYAELGKCCASGPTSKGGCGLAVAAPKDGASAATDAAGETVPCIPRRSYQWRRQSLCINLAVLTGAILLLCMTLPSRETTFVPGELSGKHAQILHNTLVSQRCGLCHPNSHTGASFGKGAAGGQSGGWGGLASLVGQCQTEPANDPGATLQFFSGDDGSQDALCMQCHQGHMPGALERTPHDLSAAMLQALASEDQAPSLRRVGDRPGDAHHSELAKTSCAACHVEHHGRGFDLKAMADDRCQACHRRKFASFTNGHPEFENFPVQRPRALAFSHQAHADKHFPQKNRDFDCRQCHLGQGRDGDAGQVARSVSFETACAQCHLEPIRAATVSGWAMLQLPSIDAKAASDDSPLAGWPLEARFGFEGTISPVLRALLAADDAVEEALASLPESGELAEIPAALGDQRAQVTQALALATERLIRETARDGQTAWRERLTKVARARTKRELNAQETALIEAMCAGLPPDLFRHMQTAWFDRQVPLADATPAQAASSTEMDLNEAASSATRNPNQRASLLAEAEFEPQQRPSHQGIVVERTSGSLLVSDGAAANNALLLEDASQSDGSNDLLLDDASHNDGLSDDALLGGPSATERSSSETDDLSGLIRPGDAELNNVQSRAESVAAPLSGATHLAGGGWYIDRDTLSLRYMPIGHADRTLAAWNMWWAIFDNSGRAAPADTVQSAGSAPHAKSITQQIPGGCIQCHQLNSTNLPAPGHGSVLTAPWRAPVPRPGVKEFTKFDHAPHLSLPAVNDCRYCHVQEKPAPSASVLVGHVQGDTVQGATMQGDKLPLVGIVNSPHEAHAGSEFRAMRLTQCVACHRPSGANSGCLQCHNYHVTSPPRAP